MKEKIILIQELIDKAEQYAKTNIALFRLKAIDKVTDIFSTVAAGIIILIILVFFVFILSVGVALWLGEVLGKVYYGFFAVAGMYALLAVILVIMRKNTLEVFFNNFIVGLIFKDKKNAGN